MTTTTQPAGDVTHELVLHDDVAALVHGAVTFLRDGAAAGDRAVVLGDRDFVAALWAAAPDLATAATVEVLAEPESDRAPARDLHRFGQMLATIGRTERVRVVNQMPSTAAARWPEWRRYEAAVNVILTPYRVWGRCAYDTRALEPGMVADLRANHPWVQTGSGPRPSAEYADLDRRVREYLDVPRHPAEATEPALVMHGVTPAPARRAVRRLAGRVGLSPTAQESVVLAANEAVTNAHLHGRPPVLLRAWAGGGAGTGTGTITVAVSDAGQGPHPLVGMVPGAADGLSCGGLWIVHLLLPDVHHRRDTEGYTLTFAADDTTTLPAPAARHAHD